ncbi:MAG: hypothetical protein RJB36_1300 [Bacteroidota bacterium]|jgi:hypothetical protein
MKTLFLSICLFFSLQLSAQKYTTAVGLRFANVGFTQLNAKRFLNANNAVELSLGGSSNYVWIQGNYEWQEKLNNDFDYYLGLGPGLGMKSANNEFMLGANGVVGAEYTMKDYPFTFAFETGPYLQLIPNLRLGWNFGLSARYVLP